MKEGFFSRAILYQTTIFSFERSNVILTKPVSGNGLEKFGILIAKLDPMDGATFFPIQLLIFEELEKMSFEDVSEVRFRYCEASLVF